jgi:hypothetical protein
MPSSCAHGELKLLYLPHNMHRKSIMILRTGSLGGNHGSLGGNPVQFNIS